MQVFLSHSTKDSAFVTALAQQLREDDFEPWLCEVDVLVGDDFVARIEEGLCKADLHCPSGRQMLRGHRGPVKNGAQC